MKKKPRWNIVVIITVFIRTVPFRSQAHTHIFIYLFIHWIYTLINQVININMELKLNEESISAGMAPHSTSNMYLFVLSETRLACLILTYFSPISIIRNWWYRSNDFLLLSLLNTNQLQLIYLKYMRLYVYNIHTPLQSASILTFIG